MDFAGRNCIPKQTGHRVSASKSDRFIAISLHSQRCIRHAKAPKPYGLTGRACMDSLAEYPSWPFGSCGAWPAEGSESTAIQ